MMKVEKKMMILTNYRIRRIIPWLILVICSVGFTASVRGQSDSRVGEGESKWSKTKEERESRIAVAEREQYSIRWIYIAGNTYTRHRDFRKRMNSEFNEGYVFKRTLLEDSVRRIAKMKTIYPITMANVRVMFDEKTKCVDFTIDVKQKPRS